jgi:hypothetical protein
MIKVYFKAGSFWAGCACDCCEGDYFYDFTFSHITGVEQPSIFESYDYEMYNGSKSREFDCLVSVFWDLVADRRQYDHFYDMCESFDDVDEDSVINMLSDKGIEVVFLEN